MEFIQIYSESIQLSDTSDLRTIIVIATRELSNFLFV